MTRKQLLYLWQYLYAGSGGAIVDGLVLRPNFNDMANLSLTSPSNGSAVFNGTSDYASIGQAIVPVGASDFSVSAWVYRTRNNAGFEEILSQWSSATSGNAFFMGFYDSNVRFSDTFGSVSVDGAGVVGQWFHICGVNDGGNNAYIYINGSLKATLAGGCTFTGQDVAVIGKQGTLSAEYIAGNLANVAVWNRALTSDEINSIMWKRYDLLTAGESTGLVAWYALDDITGTSVPDSTGTYNATAY